MTHQPGSKGMIISASYRTDIPAFYADWFNRRLDAGSCDVVNPYSGRINRVALDAAAVDGFVFWTRRLTPFMATLTRLHDRGAPFVIQFTITGYPRALEPAVADWHRTVEEIRSTAARFGPRVVVWRYDPVILTDLTPPAFHRDRVRQLSTQLAGHTDEVVLSFAHGYRKTRRNTARAGAEHGFAWTDPEDERKRELLAALGAIALEHGFNPPCARSQRSCRHRWSRRGASTSIVCPMSPADPSWREPRETGRVAAAPNRAISEPMTAVRMAVSIVMR